MFSNASMARFAKQKHMLRTGLLILADVLPRLWLVDFVDDDVL